MSGEHARKYCAIVHLPAFTLMLKEMGFALCPMNEQDEFFRMMKGSDLVCVMPRQGGKRFSVNISQTHLLDEFKLTLMRPKRLP